MDDLLHIQYLDIIGLEAINTGLLLRQNLSEEIRARPEEEKVIILP